MPLLWEMCDLPVFLIIDRVPLALAQREGNKPDVWWPILSKFWNISGIFWSFFLLNTACVSKEDFVSDAGMCFGRVVVAVDTVLRSLNEKYYWELIKAERRIFLNVSQNLKTRY